MTRHSKEVAYERKRLYTQCPDMGQLTHEQTGEWAYLESDHLVGRSQRCTLRLADSHASNEHASIRWSGDAWVLKDLGSLNRTFVDRKELKPSESIRLTEGARIAFGNPASTWQLVDSSPPAAMAVPEHGGLAVLAQDGLLALPSSDEPWVTIHRDQRGAWTIEDERSVTPVGDQAWVETPTCRFKLCLPRIFVETAPLQGLVGRRVAELSIVFRTSRDLEHIELEVSAGENVHSFGARVHNEMLLILARARLEDNQAGLPPLACGWMDQDELCRSVALDPERLNVDVHRVRQQFAELRLLDPGQIIERRPRARRLRLGTGNVSEVPI